MKKNYFMLMLLLTIVFPFQDNYAQTPPIGPSLLSHSDVPFTPRWYPYTRLLVNDSIVHQEIMGYPTRYHEKANQFHANRFLWTYKEYNIHWDTTSGYPNPSFPEFASQADSLNPRSSQYTIRYYMDPELYEAIIFFQNDTLKARATLATNLCGQPVRSEREIQENWTVNRPDYNSDDFFDFQVDQVKHHVDDGNVSFQQDESGGNIAAYNFGGSFNISSINKFRDYLSNLTSAQLTELGISSVSNFNYRDYVIEKLNLDPIQLNTSYNESACNAHFTSIKSKLNGTVLEKSKYHFEEFQRQATKSYYDSLHVAIDNYIATKNFGPGFDKGIYSVNNLEEYKWLSPHFDFWVSELYARDRGQGFVYDVRNFSRFGKSSFYEHDLHRGEVVNSVALKYTEKDISRNSIALSYANGMTMITPWDIYIPPLNGIPQSRHYGNASDYDDLYSFISDNKDLFDDYNSVEEHNYSFLSYYETVKSIDSFDVGRDKLELLRHDKLKVIPKESLIKIKDSIYEINELTEVGNIYLPIGSSNSISSGDPIEYIDLYDGEANKYTRFFDDGYKKNRPINDPDVDVTTGFITSKAPHSSLFGVVTLDWNEKDPNLNIPNNSIVNIDGVEYSTVSETFVGLIYLSKANGDLIDPTNSPSIWYIRDGNNILYPTEDKPFAITVRSKDDYRTFGVVVSRIQAGSGSNQKTSLGWTNPEQMTIIPKGSRVLINNTEYLTKDLTGNGSLHFASNEYLPDDTFNVGDDVWYIKDPDGKIIYPTHSFNESVMHVVNLTQQSKKVAVKIKKSQFTVSFANIYEPPNSSNLISEKSTLNNRIYTIDNLDKWAILKQQVIQGKTSNASKDPSEFTEDIVVYPNPNDGVFTVKLPKEYEKARITIYNSLGIQVNTVKVQKSSTVFNISNYASGLYFVKVETDSKSVTKKILIE